MVVILAFFVTHWILAASVQVFFLHRFLHGYASLVLGDMMQSHHHRHPMRANTAARWFEVDLAGLVIRGLARLGVVELRGRAAPIALAAAAVVAAHAWPRTARAQPVFRTHDVRTVFHIAKSDDRNRVDYGIHLDASCQPVGETPIYAYWHRFEPRQPRYGRLNALDARLYGIASQSVRTRSGTGSWVEMRVRALQSYRILVLTQRIEERCVARARAAVNDRPAYVDRVFVQLGGPFTVDHVTFSGRDVETEQAVRERRLPP